MQHLGFQPCMADPDVWMREQYRPDGTSYWVLLLLYVDDRLLIALNPEDTLRNEIGKYFQMKESSIGPPDIYLGRKCRKIQLENGEWTWPFSSSQYVQEVVEQ